MLVWVHGGGFTGGDSVKNDISRLGEVEDLIVVTVNYRLGPLGEQLTYRVVLNTVRRERLHFHLYKLDVWADHIVGLHFPNFD